MDKLIHMKELLTDVVYEQMGHLECVDTEELGEVIDMIKDLAKAIYYCTVTEAMHEKEWDKSDEWMYYSEKEGHHDGAHSTTTATGTHGIREHELSMRDKREGKSPLSRKNYMEAKAMHKDKTVQMHELESYAQELTNDLVEMIEEATPEEKQFLSNRIAALAAKIK